MIITDLFDKIIKDLTNDQIAILYKGLLAISHNEECDEPIPPELALTWKLLKEDQIALINARKLKSERLKANAQKRWENAKAFNCMQKDAIAYKSIEMNANECTLPNLTLPNLTLPKEEKETKVSKKNFTKPNLEEIKEYIAEKNYTFSAEAFFDFYESKNWFIGKNKMSNWYSACATWQRKQDEQPKTINQSKNKQLAKTFINNKSAEEYKEIYGF